MHRSACAIVRAVRPRSVPAATACAALALAAGLASPASALNIVLSFDANVPGAVGTAGTVRNLITQAANMWEDWIEDTHTLNLTIGWGDLDPGTLAVHTLTTEGGTPHRETAGNIDFDSLVSWFIDPTPFGDTEYTMTSTIWRDTSATNQANWFNGTALNEFEVGRTGTATAGGGASGLTDMLSVALHEMGHALGMSSANNATVAQTADGDYDYSTTLTRGGALAAVVASGGNIAHLQNSLSVMFPSFGTSARRLPSPTDIFSTASASLWTDIDLDRKFFHATSSDWDTNGNWIGNDQPDSTEDAYLLDGNTAIVSNAGNVARNVFISEAANVRINSGGVLTVSEAMTIDGLNSDLELNTGGNATINGRLTLTDTAEVFMNGGTLTLNGGATLNTGTTIRGDGIVSVNNTDLINNGEIEAQSALLTVSGLTAGVLDLDGTSGNGILSASTGDLTFFGTQSDAFDGVINIGADRTMSFINAWTLGTGTANFTTGTTTATLSGGLVTVSGNIRVTGTGQAQITAATSFTGSASVIVDTGETLRLLGDTTFNGGSYTGAGTLWIDGAATVASATTINTGIFDWDGFSPFETFTVNNGVGFVINSSVIEADVGGSFGGDIVNNGSITVNTDAAWTMAGSLVMGGTSSLNGQTVNITGTLDANGAGNDITADQVFGSSAVVTMTAAGDSLSLEGDTTFNGGSYTGAGTLRLDGDVTVASNTTIGVDTLDMDGLLPLATLTVNNGVTFTINSNVIESDPVGGFDGTANVDGVMNVNTTAAWTNAGVVDLISGVLGGTGAIINTGTLQGSGTVNAADLNNNGVISAQDASTLNINTTSFADLDGSDEAGVINAVAGNVRVLGNFGGLFFYNGGVNIGSGRQFRMDTNGLRNEGVINMTAGTYLAPDFTQAGTLNVTAGNSTLQSNTLFVSGGTTNLNAATAILRISGTARLDAGHNLNGAGELEVLAGSTLSGNGTANTDVLNRGFITPGTSVGTLTIQQSYAQAATGTYVVELSAHNVNDRINITANAALAGALDINLLGGFVPDWGDSWTIMTYATTSGDFTNFAGAPALGANLFWWREQRATSYVLGVRNAGDLDHDGDVDFTDLNNVLSFFGTPAPGGTFGRPGSIGDANEDGTVNFVDLNIVLSFFGAFAPPNVIPTPGAATLAALGIAAAGWRRRRGAAA